MTIGIGMIGCGKIAHHHAAGYRAAADLAKVVVCCDEWSIDLARQMADSVGGADAVNRWQDVIEREDVDAVSICMPHFQHSEIALAAAKAGKHILVEKPMAMNLGESRVIVEAADAAGTLVMVGQNQRFMTDHQRIKQLIDDGVIGRVVAVRFDCNQFLKKMYAEGSWMFSKDKTGGGMVICTAVHKLDLLRHFFGEIRQVAAYTGHTGLNYNMDNEDIAAMIVEFESGIIGEGFYLFAAHKVPIPTATGELTIIYGEEGMIHNIMGWHVYSTKVAEYSGGDTNIALPVEPYVNSVVYEVRHFLECIRDGKQPLTSGRDNLGTMAAIDAIYRSAERREMVNLADVW